MTLAKKGYIQKYLIRYLLLDFRMDYILVSSSLTIVIGYQVLTQSINYQQ